MASTAIKVRRTPFFFATAPRAVVKRKNMVVDFRNGSWYLTFFFRPQALPERARNASRRYGGAAQGRLSGAKASRVVRAGRAMGAG